MAERAIQLYRSDPAEFRDFVVQLVNDRGEEQAWKIKPKVVESVADLLAYGSPPARDIVGK